MYNKIDCEEYESLLNLATSLKIIDAKSCKGSITCLIGKIKKYYNDFSTSLKLEEITLIKEILEKLKLENEQEEFYNELLSAEENLTEQLNSYFISR
jgi:hypothetical protein